MRTITNADIKTGYGTPDEQPPETPIDGSENAEGKPHRIEDWPSIRYQPY